MASNITAAPVPPPCSTMSKHSFDISGSPSPDQVTSELPNFENTQWIPPLCLTNAWKPGDLESEGESTRATVSHANSTYSPTNPAAEDGEAISPYSPTISSDYAKARISDLNYQEEPVLHDEKIIRSAGDTLGSEKMKKVREVNICNRVKPAAGKENETREYERVIDQREAELDGRGNERLEPMRAEGDLERGDKMVEGKGNDKEGEGEGLSLRSEVKLWKLRFIAMFIVMGVGVLGLSACVAYLAVTKKERY